MIAVVISLILIVGLAYLAHKIMDYNGMYDSDDRENNSI